MKAVEIAKDVYGLVANIGNRDLFEGIWPIPHGVSLNSYIVKGEKVALIDLVKDWEHAVRCNLRTDGGDRPLARHGRLPGHQPYGT